MLIAPQVGDGIYTLTVAIHLVGRKKLSSIHGVSPHVPESFFDLFYRDRPVVHVHTAIVLIYPRF